MSSVALLQHNLVGRSDEPGLSGAEIDLLEGEIGLKEGLLCVGTHQSISCRVTARERAGVVSCERTLPNKSSGNPKK